MTSYVDASGVYYEKYTASLTPPSDTRYGGSTVILKYLSGPRIGQFEELVFIPAPNTSAEFVWRPPVGSQTARIYFVSHNKLGLRNSIVDGFTPSIDKTVGSTSQFDFRQIKLDTISDQFRIDPLTGLPTIYQVSALTLTDQLQVGGGTLNGVCSTANSGADTTVTKTSGDSFASTMVGTYIYVNGVMVKVKAFTSATVITVETNFGTHSGYAWSYGRPPQQKVFDRSNTLMGFWGDDTYNTGYVGLFAGRNVRLGGTIGTPILEVDSSGSVTINEATLTFTHISGGVTNTLLLSNGTFAYPVIASNSTGSSCKLGPRGTLTVGPAGTGGTTTITASPDELTFENGGDYTTIRNGVIDNNGMLFITDGVCDRYNNKSTAGMGLVPIYASVSLTGQTGSIGATNLLVGGGVAPAGRYRISWYGNTTVASGSDTLTVNIIYNNGTVSVTKSFAFLLSTTTGSGIQDISFVIKTDGVNNIQYSTTRSGATGSPQYALGIDVERLS